MDAQISKIDQDIVKTITEYIDEDIYDYAIMIDGPWGCGKTYFAREVLFKELAKHEMDKRKTSNKKKYKPKKVLYISLYGVNSVDEISNQIILDSYLTGKFKGRIKKIYDQGAKITNNILPLFLNILGSITGINIEHKSLSQIQKLFNSTTNKILVFDDLERCSLPINEMLGYINTFVEHCKMKVIIIANQNEILAIISENSNTFDIKYDVIREKLIGTTIKYHPDFNKVLPILIKNVNPKLGILLQNNISFFESFMLIEQHQNLRTFQFFLSSLDKLYLKIIQVDGTYKKDTAFMNNIIQYGFRTCILFKKNTYNYSWNPATQEYALVQIDLPTSTTIFAIKFIDDFLIFNILNEEQINNIENIYESYKRTMNKSKTDIVQFLRMNWYTLDDESIEKRISEILTLITEGQFELKNYPEIISLFATLEQVGFADIIERMTSRMKEYINSRPIEHIVLEEKYAIMLEGKVEERYKEILANIQEEINKNVSTPYDLSKFLQDTDDWATKLYKYVIQNQSEIVAKDGFMVWFNIQNLTEKIETSDSKNINDFRSCIISLYLNHDIRLALTTEKEKIEGFRDALKKLDFSHFDKIKKMQINYLEKNLIQIIQIYNSKLLSSLPESVTQDTQS